MSQLFLALFQFCVSHSVQFSVLHTQFTGHLFLPIISNTKILVETLLEALWQLLAYGELTWSMHERQKDLLACPKESDQDYLGPTYTHAVANAPKLCIKLCTFLQAHDHVDS